MKALLNLLVLMSKASPSEINKVASFPTSRVPQKVSIPNMVAVFDVINCSVFFFSKP